MNAGAASAQTSVFLTQESSKSNEFTLLLITAEGKRIIVEAPAITVHKFSEGLASIFTTDKKYGFIDTEGHLVISACFSNVGYFKNGLAWAKDENGKLGFIDKSGNWAVPPQFDAVKAFGEVSGLARGKRTACGGILTIKENG